MQCPQHGVEFVLKPAGVSKKTGKPYNAFQVCPTYGCNEKPGAGGWQGVRQQVAQKVAPEKAIMTKEDWEAKEERTDRKILLQVAFKAAVELYGKVAQVTDNELVGDAWIFQKTLTFHSWLLSQLDKETATSPKIHSDPLINEANEAFDRAME